MTNGGRRKPVGPFTGELSGKARSMTESRARKSEPTEASKTATTAKTAKTSGTSQTAKTSKAAEASTDSKATSSSPSSRGTKAPSTASRTRRTAKTTARTSAAAAGHTGLAAVTAPVAERTKSAAVTARESVGSVSRQTIGKAAVLWTVLKARKAAALIVTAGTTAVATGAFAAGRRTGLRRRGPLSRLAGGRL